MRNFTNVFNGINMSFSSSIASSKAVLGAFIFLLSFSLPESVVKNNTQDKQSSNFSPENICIDADKRVVSSDSSMENPYLYEGVTMKGSESLLVDQVGPLASIDKLKDYSKFFIHEVVEGRYELIKNIQHGTEVILRPDRIEILRKADPAKGIEEVSTFLLFSNVNNVQPNGKELIESNTFNVKDIYNEATAEYLGSDVIDINVFKSAVYTNIFDGVDLEIDLNDAGDMVFSVNKVKGNSTFPFDFKVWDAKAKSSINGIITNGVEITSNSDNISFQNGKVGFEKRNSSRNGYSFTLNLSNPSQK